MAVINKIKEIMRILMTSEQFLPQMGGGEMHVWYLGDQLVKAGHQLTLLTNEPSGPDETVPTKPVSYRVIRLPWKKGNIFSLFKIMWRLSKTVDVIHAHFSYRLAAMAGIVGFFRRKPVVVTLHGRGTLNEPGAKFPYKQAHALYRFLSLNLATKIIATSEDMAVVARRYLFNKKKIVNIVNGVDTAIFNLGVEIPPYLTERYRGRKVILTVRRLVPKNGIHFLVEALPHIKKRIPEVVYLMVGAGRMEGYIKSRIKDLNLADHIEMLGEISNQEVVKYLKLAEVVVFPSTAESSSIACAEAMAMKKKVVASRVGGLIELLGKDNERGTLVKLVDWEGSNYDAPISLPVDRYEALAEAIVEDLSGGHEDKAEKAFRYAHDNLSWEVISHKTEEVYHQLLCH